MPKYRVRFTEHSNYDVDIEAPNKDVAASMVSHEPEKYYKDAVLVSADFGYVVDVEYLDG